MNVSINGRKVKITPEIRRYIEKNMKKLDHFADHINDFKLIIKRERYVYFAEVNINMKRKIVHIFAKTPDMYSVIDTLFDKIDVKIRRYRDRLIYKRSAQQREGAAAAAGGAGIADTAGVAGTDEATIPVQR